MIFCTLVCVPRVFWCTPMKNTFPLSETMQSPSVSSLPYRPHFFPSWRRVFGGLDPIEPSPDRARLPCINQNWGSAEMWANQLDPGKEAKSSCGLAWSNSCRKRGRRKSVWARESLTCCKENSELVRIKAKEKEREQDGDLAAKEGLSDVVTQLDVYT